MGIESDSHSYETRPLSELEKLNVSHLQDMGKNFNTMCDSFGEGEELSTAKTKMEEAVFWAVKYLTKQ